MSESREEGKVIPCRGAKDEKGVGTSCAKSGMRNLEANGVKSRMESAGGCVKLKTATEMR